MRNGSERGSSSSSPLDCDVGLGLKMPLQPSDESLFNNQLGYEPAADTFVLPRGFYTAAFRTPGGGMGASGKALFTASQWQELERQKTIHKYIMASIPVPPQLLLPISTTQVLPSFPQSNIHPGLDLRYPSAGSDPEPWRCKRTDGKKWRCSRDVAPDQKYCERHAHKTRTRSRKHVETPSSYNSTNAHRSSSSSSSSSHQSMPTMASAASYDQTCSIEWFTRGSNITSNQHEWQQLMQQISSSSSNRDHNKNVSLHERQSFVSLNPFNVPNKDGVRPGDQNNSTLGSKTGFSSLPHATTRHFIDAWDKESSSNKFPPISSNLTLSMSGGEDHRSNENNAMNSDRDGECGILRGVSWTNSSTPGGPLGEALCLGSNGGYSNYSNTNSSKSSCEEGSHGLNFIG